MSFGRLTPEAEALLKQMNGEGEQRDNLVELPALDVPVETVQAPIPTPAPTRAPAEVAPSIPAPQKQSDTSTISKQVEESSSGPVDTSDIDRTSAHERLWNEYQELKKQRTSSLKDAESRQFKADLFAALGNMAPGVIAGATAMNTKANVKPAEVNKIIAPDHIARADARYKVDRDALLAEYKSLGTKTDAEMRKAKIKYMEAQANKMNRPEKEKEDKPTAFEKKADEEAAKLVSKWGDGHRDMVYTDINALKEVEAKLQAVVDGTGSSFTGKKTAIPFQKVFNEEGVSVTDSVAGVTQKNLREILGGQFAEKEGEQLIKRAYDPLLSEAENLKRVRKLRTAMEQSAKAKDALTNYAQKNSTVKGYKRDLSTNQNASTESAPATVKFKHIPSGEVKSIRADKAEKYLNNKDFQKVD